MSNEKKKNDNLVKRTSQEATDFFGHTVDTTGKIGKSISGEGGLVGKAFDSSGRILKGTAGTANNIIGKSSDLPGKYYRKATNREGNKRNKKQNDEEK
ncbi:hypothetical protein [Virgibacillus necropolis]|uniref:Uncharacterized protein n=1 Tax=Virgibacillus necropolis TaxID=163877 RepID=A0A221M842_9BACI|nr:hypothetical protein [Virgibacillus necropolis]ASN03813.1 hypothetical protein CFK40_01745 [Virgibacillus necropolis]